MPESAEEFYTRVAGSLRIPEVHEGDPFPFEGEIRPRTLLPPTDGDPVRQGEGGVDCQTCVAADDQFCWTNEHWRLFAPKPMSFPIVVLLEPRVHFEEPGDLPDDLAADLGIMLGRLERAVRSIEGIGRVHVCRWGDGGAHLHWWFIGRPARFPQLLGSYATAWMDLLPPTPDHIWHENVQHVARRMEAEV